MANPRRRKIRKISAQAVAIAQAAGNEVALEAAKAIDRKGRHSVAEAEGELARVEALCAAKAEKKQAEKKPAEKPKAKSKAKSVASKIKKALSKDEE